MDDDPIFIVVAMIIIIIVLLFVIFDPQLIATILSFLTVSLLWAMVPMITSISLKDYKKYPMPKRIGVLIFLGPWYNVCAFGLYLNDKVLDPSFDKLSDLSEIIINMIKNWLKFDEK